MRRENMEALWQVLRICDVCGYLLNEIKIACAINQACVRVKWGESECFKIDNGVRQGCIMSPWLFNLHKDAARKKMKIKMGRMGMRFLENGIKSMYVIV